MLTGGPAPRVPHATLIDALAAVSGRASAILLDGQEQEHALRWELVYTRARRLAAALAREGVRAGDRVILVLPTGVDFLDAFFGTLVLGAVPVPLYPPVRLGRLEEYHAATARMISAVGGRIVLTDARVSRLLGVALERARPPLGLRHVATLLAEVGTEELEPAGRGEDLALIQFSSGSTVDPKPVMLTHTNVLSQCAMVSALIPEPGNPDAAGVSWLPLYHDMGLIGGLLTAVYHGGNIVLIPPEQFLARPGVWLRALSRHRAIISPAPNFAYAVAAQRVTDAELDGVDLSAWRFALCGAEPVSPAVMRRFAERFGRFGFDARALMPVYGLAEAALAVTFTRPGPLSTVSVDAETFAREGVVRAGDRELVSVGTPVPGVAVEVRDSDGAPLDPGVVGHVHVRGPAIMRGYFGRPDATAAVLSADGWLDTGDLGFVFGGELYISGRAKDVIAVRGAKRAPQEVEEVLDHLAGVRPGCAVAVGYQPADADGEALLLLVEKKRPTELDDTMLARHVRDAVLAASGLRAHHVEILEPGTLPRTSSGKLRRSEARARFLAGTLSAPEKVGALTLARELARSTLAKLRHGPGAG